MSERKRSLRQEIDDIVAMLKIAVRDSDQEKFTDDWYRELAHASRAACRAEELEAFIASRRTRT